MITPQFLYMIPLSPRIKEETNTRIDLPSEDNDSNVIVITGKKADVDNARKRLLAIQAELEGE